MKQKNGNRAGKKAGTTENRKTVNRQSFLHGALILTLGMAIVKIVGALFKVPLKYAIQEYGMGLFNVAYNFYGPIHSLAIAGLPIAISRMVSESYSRGRYRDITRIKKVSTPICLTLGILGTALMFFGAPVYCSAVIKNDNALLPMLALAPAVLFGCLGAIYRGFYEGLKDMYPTAISEVIEALSKLIIGLAAAIGITGYLEREYVTYGTVFGKLMESADEAALITLSFAAAGAIVGVTCGSLFSFLYLSMRYRRKKAGITPEMLKDSPKPYTRKTIAKRLVITAIPIAIGSVTMNVAGLIDTTFLQSRIGDIINTAPDMLLAVYKGMIPDAFLRNPETIPNYLYGCYALALTVYMLVPTITQAFSISALPNMTEVWTRGDKREIKLNIESVVRITALFSLPAGIGISALATPVTRLLYGNDESTPIIAGVLFLLGLGAAVAAIATPISSMLQAVGRADLPVKMLVIAMGIKVAANYFLCGIPEINILGAGIGTLLCYLFLVVAELILLCRVTGVKIEVKSTFVKPAFSALFCGVAARVCSDLAAVVFDGGGRVDSMLCTACGVGAGGVFYIICLVIFNGIDKNDVLMLPKGQKIAKLLEKRGWI